MFMFYRQVLCILNMQTYKAGTVKRGGESRDRGTTTGIGLVIKCVSGVSLGTGDVGRFGLFWPVPN